MLQFTVNVHFFPAKKALTNSEDPDQMASEAAWSGSSLFAILTSILLIRALISHIFFENRKWKVFGIIEHLPYIVSDHSISLLLNQDVNGTPVEREKILYLLREKKLLHFRAKMAVFKACIIQWVIINPYQQRWVALCNANCYGKTFNFL